jgi:hypothetical protein
MAALMQVHHERRSELNRATPRTGKLVGSVIVQPVRMTHGGTRIDVDIAAGGRLDIGGENQIIILVELALHHLARFAMEFITSYMLGVPLHQSRARRAGPRVSQQRSRRLDRQFSRRSIAAEDG